MPTNYYTDTSEDSIDSEELLLYNLMMEYRLQNGLPSIALSKALTIVASRHTLDTVENVGELVGHAWSDAPYDAADSATYPSMWEAPQRLSTGYVGNGFEISTGYSGTAVQTTDMDAARALSDWQGSTAHNDVILNLGPWGQTWNAIGIAIHKGVAHVWFGYEVDPTGAPAGVGVTTAGNDTFVLAPTNESIDGGAGIDIVIFAAERSEVTLSMAGDQINSSGASTGSDQFTNVERLKFSDGTLAFDLTGSAGQTFRLYRAAFDREPDQAGLTHNVNIMDGGLSIFDMANAFIGSAEFKQTYGDGIDNTTFVTLLYQNVLDRAPDQVGLDGWLAQLGSGQTDRQHVLFGFSESAENKTATAPLTDDGIWLA